MSSTLIYSLAALAVAARIFGAEEVLYSEQSGWSDMMRRPRHMQPAATVSNALVCLALMVPINFLLRGLFFTPGELPSVADFVLFMSLGSILLFAVLPAVAAYWSRVSWSEGFSLRPASLLSLAGCVILGLTLWPMVLQIKLWLHVDLSEEAMEQAKKIVELFQSAGPILTVPLGLAALTEELFFRGYLFAALQRAVRPMTAIVVTGVLFGVMHSVIGGSLGAEQMLPATLLGLILGCIRWQTNSVLPGMALHLVHNVLLALLVHAMGDGGAQVADDVSLRVVADRLGMPAMALLLASGLGIPAGTLLVYLGGKSSAKVAKDALEVPVLP